MTKPTEQEIERIARAMCVANGYDPDGKSDRPYKLGLANNWHLYQQDAISFLAGYRAMQEWQ